MNEGISVNSEVVNFVCEEEQKNSNCSKQNTANVLRLLKDELTVPFIARYRKKETGGMDADSIRQIQLSFENFKKIQDKVSKILKQIGSEASDDLVKNLKTAKSIEEVNELYAPFKKGGNGTLAERARKLGLNDIADAILKTPDQDINIARTIKPNIDGLKTEKDILDGVQHIIADLVFKDVKVQEKMNEEIGRKNVFMVTKEKRNGKDLDKNNKFAIYYNFNCCCQYLKSYQILAINRAEAQKIISVKLEVNQSAKSRFLHWLKSNWVVNYGTHQNKTLINDAINDSYNRLIEKSHVRRLRSRLSKEAELEATEIFSHNLRQLLLIAPVKNETVLSIDPGFKNGCKVAVINKNGVLLESCVIYPFMKKKEEMAKSKLEMLVKNHMVSIIALGNGTACRQTECLISEMIKDGDFKPINIQYSIVNESGASTYSVTKEAKNEFGDLDPNLISAVSIGRRLQDPLLELIKIEAKHIGVGMYQHDVNEGLLKAATDGVIEDCVSFVGVDLNACSVNTLKRLAGISQKQAESIIEYREKNGEFVSRNELECVKGIGKVTYRNIAGFVRIIPKRKNTNIETENIPSTSQNRKRKLTSDDNKPEKRKKKTVDTSSYLPEVLDQTCIHPESYDLTCRVMKFLEVSSDMIGTSEMKEKIKRKLGNNDIYVFIDKFKVDKETLLLIFDGLQQSIDYDLRADFEKPAFKTGLTSIDQLKRGQRLPGVVRNTTSFGVFVDIGIVCDGLIHSSKLHADTSLGPGDRVESEVFNVDVDRERVGLLFIRKISKDVVLK